MGDDLEDLASMVDAIDFGESPVLNVQNLTLMDILSRLESIDSELRDLDELLSLNVQSERGRELHSERAALVIEKHRRLSDG